MLRHVGKEVFNGVLSYRFFDHLGGVASWAEGAKALLLLDLGHLGPVIATGALE